MKIWPPSTMLSERKQSLRSPSADSFFSLQDEQTKCKMYFPDPIKWSLGQNGSQLLNYYLLWPEDSTALSPVGCRDTRSSNCKTKRLNSLGQLVHIVESCQEKEEEHNYLSWWDFMLLYSGYSFREHWACSLSAAIHLILSHDLFFTKELLSLWSFQLTAVPWQFTLWTLPSIISTIWNHLCCISTI